jgi:AcrR family transcriptional regulator
MPRVRSARAHEQVLSAAQELFSERGIDGASMDAIAETSGVSKATIYKHWPDKDALCLEVLYRLKNQIPIFETDDLRADLTALLNYEVKEQKSAAHTRLMQHLHAYAAKNHAFAMELRARIMEPPVNRITELLKRGLHEGSLRSDLEISVGIALLLGPMMYRYVTAVTGKPIPQNLAEQVADAFWRAYGVVPAAKPARKIAPGRRR